MPLKSSDKQKETNMEKKIFPILVVNNSNLKPYIEIFDYHPENIIQHPLGILAGFFEIREYSEDSAYIVNFLNSVLKKEYYANHKRPVPDSFDGALHKINLALSEIAKHGNVNWIGKLDSAICAFEKNSMHFTVTGNAKILLWRNGILTDIAEGLAPDELEPHPLKTFINVSSGKLEKNDQIMITSGDIFNILSINDIQRSLKRFDKEKLHQFLRTALTNELDLSATIMVDVEEPRKNIQKKQRPTLAENLNVTNAFSGKTFDKKERLHIKTQQDEIVIQESDLKNNSEYTDNKTGHIYVQGKEEHEKQGAWGDKAEIIKGMIHDAAHTLSHFLTKQLSSFWKNIKNAASFAASYGYAEKISLLKSKFSKKASTYSKENDFNKKQDASKTESSFTSNHSYSQILPEKDLPDEDEVEYAVEKFSPKEQLYSLIFSFKLWMKKTRIRFFSNDKSIFHRANDARALLPFPSSERIKDLFSRLSRKQKILAVIIVAIIILGPLVFTKISRKKEIPAVPAPIDEKLSLKEKLSQDKNIAFTNNTERISSDNEIIEIFPLVQGLYISTKTKIVAYSKENKREEFSWPENYGSGKLSAYMDDLGLIFIITDGGKVVSFSPVSNKFSENALSLPEKASADSIGTYMTYLYVLSKDDNNIYRYPRGGEGFGAPMQWLQENIPLSQVSKMTIDESIYFTDGSSLSKLFKGKKENIQFENSATSISYDAIFTSTDTSSLWTLDNKNSRLVKYDKSNGLILAQYHNDSLEQASSFSVDESSDTAFFSTPNGLVKMKMK